MLTYSKALELKNAGFPQVFKGGDEVFYNEKVYIHLGGGHNGDEGLYAEKGFTCCLDEFNKVDSDIDINRSIFNIMDSDIVLAPTLLEIMEELGSDLSWLKRLEVFNVTWEAACNKMPGIASLAPYPDEACADLYLALHK